MAQPLFIFASYLPGAAVSATDTATGYSAANVLQANEDTSWKPADTVGTNDLVIDLGAALPVGAIAIAGEYLLNVTMEVRGSTDNFSSSNVQLVAPFTIEHYTTAYGLWTNATYRYIKIRLSNVGASTEIYHVAIQQQNLLPYLDDGFDPDSFKTEGEHLIAVDGHLLGSVQSCTLRELALNFGQVTDTEIIPFQRWADACVKTLTGYFFIPDSAETLAHFGWTDSKYTFKTPYKSGLRTVGVIPYISRVV